MMSYREDILISPTEAYHTVHSLTCMSFYEGQPIRRGLANRGRSYKRQIRIIIN